LATDLGPGNGLDGSAIELRDAPVYFHRPSGGFGVLVDVGVEAVEERSGEYLISRRTRAQRARQ